MKFLLETAAAARGMDNFNEYLKGSKFTLYKDITKKAILGTTQVKTLSQLKTTMIEHDFETQDRQKLELLDFLKKRQKGEKQEDTDQGQATNRIIHVDLINTDENMKEAPCKTILSITNDTRTFTQVAVITNREIDSMVSAIWHYWCQPYRPLQTIIFNQGKIRASQLESRINDFMPIEQKIHC